MNDVNIYSTVISNNISRGVRGYNDSRQSRPRLFNCTIVDNVATNGESGAGAYHCELHDCTVVGNRIQGKAGNGAGCSACRIYGGMVASNVVNGVSSKDSLGGGVCDCTVHDCKIVGNLLGYGHGGGCSSSTLEDCQICDNTITNGGFKGAGCYYCLVNCTIVNNPEGGFAGLKAVFNCIAWGNGTDDSSCTACTNSCVEKLSCSKQSGCFSTDPRLDARYAPKSTKCHNKALPFDWMTDPNDVRSKDVYGAARVQGKGCDIGAVEQPDCGMIMMVR